MPRSRASFTIRVVSSWPRLPMFILRPNCMLPSATSLTMSPVCPSVRYFISCTPLLASLEENLRHHALVLVVQQMAVEHRHPADHRVGEVHDDVDRTADRHVHRIHPVRVADRPIVFQEREKVHLMDVHRVQLACVVGDSPVLKLT